jgi:hypothetical protein
MLYRCKAPVAYANIPDDSSFWTGGAQGIRIQRTIVPYSLHSAFIRTVSITAEKGIIDPAIATSRSANNIKVLFLMWPQLA